MWRARVENAAIIGFTLFTGLAGTAVAPGSGSYSLALAQDSVVCTKPDATTSVGSTTLSDFTDGVSSDGRGRYVLDADGVATSEVHDGTWLTLWTNDSTLMNQRKFTVNLNNPVPGGGAVPLGIITTGNGAGFHARWWSSVGNEIQNVHRLAVGQTVTVAQMGIGFSLNGRPHLLQMGPRPAGVCASGGHTLVHGRGTSSGTIYRASPTKWVTDLPAGSVGRLFDLSNTAQHAEDRGLYYVRVHYESDAVPLMSDVLQRVAETQGGAAVVARYRVLKRDSASAYYFGEGSLLLPGNWLLNNKDPQDAVIVFRLSVEEYPANWRGYDRLGAAYVRTGDTARAVASYQRSLELNPKNQNTADVLKRLGAKP